MEVAKDILKAHEKDKWNKEWLLVEAFHHAEHATIIVSEDKSAGLELVASANVAFPAVSLADPEIGLSIASTQGKIVHVVGAKKLHPLYSCLRLKDPLFGEPSIKPVRGAGEMNGEVRFSRPGIDELLDS
jgi:hypothetical protein